ncbi:protein TrpH [Clostridium pasteurianum DSM 525 = ATCC 6013]|uniref:PHP domain protein n=1 Tax=Clostridium pasteurianum DSM 525 = ATCC 6013 TaxID=1262449 RepID=A0A0H3JAM1_CLOPA|nr:PHP domain-containing protein [Clostridium pasteurianum]AJA48685.1 protein TrpH [Clostridium pasteurianum DSM 525 = ATCC 6013]AJA52673.1 protein TrpH [Clostridium pasteurianum DSM 525 = ATCC 6013]AOZ75911.1 hydrolase [Clostridium pasteurianum DSM 525 = ATCC 6013]AOZ79707.1 hydrolase [Clostridium pasteurianum]ELP59984.1 metal-dependent phosphoesterase (PHP family) protein [Clostridium pasteurianum DSM 525 = ATCC 6013]
MYFKGDFHSHSTESDGKLSPEELVTLAKTKDIDIMAITDHDTTKGINKAVLAGNKLNLKVIPGMELSTRYNDESIHVLAYFKDDSFNNSDFQDFLKNLTDYRVKRAEIITSNLKKFFDIDIDYKKVLQSANGVVARPHIAKAIINAGYNYTIDYIFKNIINEGSPAYVPNKKLPLEEGIQLLRSVNSIVVLAHPVLAKKTPVKELLKFDFDGIEAIYPLNTSEDTERLLKLAKDYNKLITAGSDFHSGEKADTKHGTLGSVYLDSYNIEKFLKKFNQ